MLIDVAIIGAGPAGIAAAIQCRRYDLKTLVFEKAQIGGLLTNANLVENYPGFPQGITGPNLVKQFMAHLQSAGITVCFETVSKIDYTNNLFSVNTINRKIKAKYVVLASGTRPKISKSPIAKDIRTRVYYDVYALKDLKGKQIVIVGAGDAAFDYALNLARQNQVILLNRGSRVKCLPLLWRRVQSVAAITYRENITITQINPALGGGLHLSCKSLSGKIDISAAFLVFAIGRTPECSFLSERIITEESRLRSDGLLYLVGDVQNGLMRQSTIAVADGIKAAMTIYKNSQELV